MGADRRLYVCEDDEIRQTLVTSQADTFDTFFCRAEAPHPLLRYASVDPISWFTCSSEWL